MAKPGPNLPSFALRILVFVVGCLGLVWGISNLERGTTTSDFWDVDARLLRFETFNQSVARKMLQSSAAQNLSACDSQSQRALLLIEIPLADAALRSGAVHEFDERIQSLEARTRGILSCTPRNSFAWLVAFGLEIEHGALNEHSFDLLAMSYEISPNEAWVAVRRIIVALPVILAAPRSVQDKILTEFQNLIRHGFMEIPVHSYLNAPALAQALLQSRIEQLDPLDQRKFSDALQERR